MREIFIDKMCSKKCVRQRNMRTPRDSGECQNEMKMGEMLMSKNFTFLEKAMSAMELMDPQIF